jgi:probable rRNA maturation factor
MELDILNHQDKVPVLTELQETMGEIVRICWQLEGRPGSPEVSVVLCDNEQIRELNKNYRGIDESTDVLSFPQEEMGEGEEVVLQVSSDSAEPVLLGDVVISLEKAVEQSQAYGHGLEREVGYLLAHGLLHLLGMDHSNEEDRARMREKEEQILAQVQLSR